MDSTDRIADWCFQHSPYLILLLVIVAGGSGILRAMGGKKK